MHSNLTDNVWAVRHVLSVPPDKPDKPVYDVVHVIGNAALALVCDRVVNPTISFKGRI